MGFLAAPGRFFTQLLANSLAAIRCGLCKKIYSGGAKNPYLIFLPAYPFLDRQVENILILFI